MLDRITNELEGDEQRNALTALKGLVADEQDEAAQEVNQILDRIYKVSPFEAISDYRAQKIARTEGNTVKELMRREQYEANEFVVGLTWLAALQPGVTRDAHLAANEQTVPKGAPFIVDNEKLNYPGDSSLGASASNTINCRCRTVAEVE
jgi:hypothetical protein